MLWRILQAWGGTLPDDVKVIFANTGKEMPETLDFVKECGERWNVPIIWLEFTAYQEFKPTDEELKYAWRIVSHFSASRKGEPFKQWLDYAITANIPNPIARQCTVQLKIRTIERYLKGGCGWDEWVTAIGIRKDEPYRVAKIREDPSGGRSGQHRIIPLADAGIAINIIGEFWKEQEFDLKLPNMNGTTMHGNCDLCFLKGANQIISLIREQPKRAEWWMNAERESEEKRGNDGFVSRFRKDRPSYAAMHKMALNQGELFKFDDEALQDCACTD